MESLWVIFIVFSCTSLPWTDATSTVSGKAVQCLECTKIAKPEDCLNNVMCPLGDICMAEHYVTTEGHVFYDVGCKEASVCAAAGFNVSSAEIQKRKTSHLSSVPVVGRRKRQNSNEAVHVCEECCEDNFCNNFLCGGHETRTLKCISCSEVEDVSICDKVEACHPYEVCFIEETVTDQFQLRYNTGCMKESLCESAYLSKQNSGNFFFDLCFYCCNSSFCNINCPKGVRPTTVKTTATTDTFSSITTTTTEPTTILNTMKTSTTTPKPITTKSIHSTSTSTTPTTTSSAAAVVSACPTFASIGPVHLTNIFPSVLRNVGCGGKDEIVFLSEMSLNVSDYDKNEFKAFIQAFTNTLDIGADKARLGLAVYNKNPRIPLHLHDGKDFDVINKRLSYLENSLPTSQGSELGRGIKYVIDHMFSNNNSRPGAKRYLIILSRDDIEDIPDAVNEAQEAKAEGVNITFIGIGSFHGQHAYLSKVVSPPTHTHLFLMNYVTDLNQLIEEVIFNRCGDTSSVLKATQVQCGGPKFLCNLGCGRKEDIALLVDTSDSVSTHDISEMTSFIHKLVEGFHISPDATWLRLVTFNTNTTMLIGGHANRSKAGVLHKIDSVLGHTIPQGETYTHTALKDLLPWSKHGRPDASKIAIIFTDGGSSAKLDTIASALELHRHNVTMFVVSIGDDVDLKEQMILATDPDVEHMVNLQTSHDLRSYIDYLSAVHCKG